jgi:hypothetical protein
MGYHDMRIVFVGGSSQNQSVKIPFANGILLALRASYLRRRPGYDSKTVQFFKM